LAISFTNAVKYAIFNLGILENVVGKYGVE